MTRGPTTAWALGVFAAATLLGRSLPAAAPERVEAALASWDVRAARALLQDGVDGWSRARTLLAWGHLQLLEGDYRAAEDSLARVPEGDPTAARLLAVVRAARAATRDAVRVRAPSGRFVVFHAAGADEALVPYLLEAADAAYDVLQARLGMTVPLPIRIEILPDLATLAAASGLPADDVRASGAVAVCKYAKLMLVSPAQFPWGYPYADTVAHELVHYFLAVRAGDRLPVWFQEAAAKYLEPAWRGAEPGTLPRGMRDRLATAVVQGRLIPFATMRNSLGSLPRAEDTALAFAQLSSLAGWLVRRSGPAVLPALADALAREGDEAAVRRVTGLSLAEALAAWGRDLATHGLQGATAARERVLEEGDDPAAACPESAGHLRLGDLLLAEGRARAAVGEYRAALARCRTQEPPMVARLAAALVDAGQPGEALALLDAAALDESEFPRLARERGRALARLDRLREALPPLLVAVRTDPFDGPVHEALERAYAAAGDAAAAERERRLAGLWR